MSKIRDLISNNLPTALTVNRGRVSQSLASLQDEMNRLFNHYYHGMEVRMTDWENLPASSPAVNVSETGEGFKIDAALPGIDAKNIKVEIVCRMLTISSEFLEEKTEAKDGKTHTYLRREISTGAFIRSVQLPETADCDKAVAEFRNGILTVSVPKLAEAQQKSRKIDVKLAA